MYFDTAPKMRRIDLFDFDSEYKEITNFLLSEREKCLVVYGLRRTGKTSLIRVATSESKIKHIWLDGRNIDGKTEFFNQLTEELKSKKLIPIDEIEIKGVKLSFENSIKKMLKDSKDLVLVIDEAQYLAPFGLDKFFAYLYDNFNVKLIFSGSEIGVLNKFIGKENADAPLYGRAISEIKTSRLNKNDGMRFLLEGGKRAGIDINEKEAEETIKSLDGIIGWLTLYGWQRKTENHKTALEKAIEVGKAMAEKEFDNFLATRKAKKRYLQIIKILSQRKLSWSEIKALLSKELGYEVSDKQFNLYLKHLEDYCFIEKADEKYHLADPLLEMVFY